LGNRERQRIRGVIHFIGCAPERTHTTTLHTADLDALCIVKVVSGGEVDYPVGLDLEVHLLPAGVGIYRHRLLELEKLLLHVAPYYATGVGNGQLRGDCHDLEGQLQWKIHTNPFYRRRSVESFSWQCFRRR